MERIRFGRLRYAAALVAVVAALAVSLAVHSFFVTVPFMLFFPAVAFSAWAGGVRAGVLALLLSMVLANYFLLPPYNGLAREPVHLLQSAGFLLTGGIIVWLTGALRLSQQATAEGREWFRVSLTSIGDAVIATDLQGQVTFINPAAQMVTGWTQTEAVGRPLTEVFRIVHEDTLQPVENPAQKALREGVVVGLANHTLLIRKDGKRVPIDDSAAPIFREDEMAGVVLVFRDVSERRKRENAQAFLNRVSDLLASSLDMETTLKNIATLAVPHIADWVAIDMVDNQGELQQLVLSHINPVHQKLVENLRVQLLAAKDRLNPPLTVLKTGQPILVPEITEERMRAAATSEDMLRLFRELKFKSALYVPIQMRGETLGVLTFSAGESGRVFGQDDLELAQALANRAAIAIEHARLYATAQEQRERLFVTLSSIGDAVIATDNSGKITFMNGVAETLTGWMMTEAGGRHLDEVFVIVNESTRQPVESPVAKVLREGTVVGLANHTLLIARDGREIPIDDSGAPIRDGSGGMMGTVLVFRDITQEKQAEEIRRTLDLVLARMDEAFSVIDADERFTYVNERAAQLSGLTRETLLGAKLPEVFPQLTETEIFKATQRALKEQTSLHVEYFLEPYGRWFEYRLYPTGTGLATFTTDITERKQAEAKLRESEKRYRTIFQTVPVSIWEEDFSAVKRSIDRLKAAGITDFQQYFAEHPEFVQQAVQQVRVTDVNKATLEMSGAPGREILIGSLERIFTPETYDIFVGELLAIANGDTRFGSETTIATYTGEPLHVVFDIRFPPPDDDYSRVLVSLVDVTERKQAENRVTRLQALTAAFSRALTVDDIAQVILGQEFGALGVHVGSLALLTEDGVSLEMRRYFGFPDELMPQFRRLSLDARTPLTDSVRTGEPVWLKNVDAYRREYPALAAQTLEETGTQALASIPLSIDGRVVGGIGMSFRQSQAWGEEDYAFMMAMAQQCAQAIERARLYEQEREARAAAEQADRLKLVFLGMISHELRTPLTSIKGFTSSLLATDVQFGEATKQEFIAIVDQEADKLTDLVDQLIDMARIHAGSLRIEPSPQPLVKAVDIAVAQLDTLTANHQLLLDIAPDLPPVLMDSQRIAQVLANLVGNASKFSPPHSRITVSASAGSGEVQVNVSDEGEGIPPEQRLLVFEAFRQVEQKPGRGRGVGLGLAICKGVVEAHGGRIWLQERDGRGTTISFTLPVG